MDPLSATASVVAIIDATIKILQFVNDIRDAPKERGELERELASTYSLLISLKYHLDVASTSEAWHNAIRTLGIENGPLEQYSIALAETQSSISAKSKTRSAIKWPFIKDKVKSLLQRMERLKAVIHIVLQIDQLELSQSIKHDTANIRETLLRTETNHVDAQLRRALDWIAPANIRVAQPVETLSQQASPAAWFFDSTSFTEWTNNKSQTLFCLGIPGAGKTVLASLTLENLRKNKLSQQIGVAGLYCHYNNEANLKATDMLGAMVKQLVEANPSVGSSLLGMYVQHSSRGAKATMADILQVTEQIISGYSTVYVVIDALDEYSNAPGCRKDLLKSLMQMQNLVDFRLMVTSRDIPDIAEYFTRAKFIHVKADPLDVRAYLSSRVENMPAVARKNDALLLLIEDTIIDAVDGMFLLARLYHDRLVDATNIRQIKTILSAISKQANDRKDPLHVYADVYEDALTRIDNQSSMKRELARKALCWVTFAKHPLSKEELRTAMAIELGDEELDEDNTTEIADILSLSAGLLTLSERHSSIVCLVHYTAQEYLESNREKWSPTADQFITLGCLTYLSFNTFQQIKPGKFVYMMQFPEKGPNSYDEYMEDKFRDDFRLEEIERAMAMNGEHPFIWYAANYWTEHIRDCQNELMEQAMSFMMNKALISKLIWLEPWNTHQDPRGDLHNDCTALHICALFNLDSLFKTALGRLGPESINSKDCTGQTPLHLAAMWGHNDLVEYIIDQKDANLFARSNAGMIPIEAAVARGQLAAVKLLAERTGFCPIGSQLQDRESGNHHHDHEFSLLRIAIANHRLAIVQYLVDTDLTGTRYVGASGDSALHLAAASGDPEIVKLLLERKIVDSYYKNFHHQTPLMIAAKTGHLEIVQLLAEREDVDLDAKCSEQRTAFGYAMLGGKLDVVKYLSGKDVDVETKDCFGSTPLHDAVKLGFGDVVWYCTHQLPINLHIQDSNGMTVLLLAAEYGWGGILEDLAALAPEAVDLNHKDKAGNTAIDLAARKGYYPMLRDLAARAGSNFDSLSKEGQTLLSQAEKKFQRLEEREKRRCTSYTMERRLWEEWCKTHPEELALCEKLIKEAED